MLRINRQEIHLWLRTGASMMFNILSGELCVYMYHSEQRLGQQRVINQRKLASSRWTLSRSILLSLCALFSRSLKHRNIEPKYTGVLKYALMHAGLLTGQPGVACARFSCTDTCWSVRGRSYTCTLSSSPGVWKLNMKQTYGDSPHDPLPNHVEQTETVGSATTRNLLYMIYYTDTLRLVCSTRARSLPACIWLAAELHSPFWKDEFVCVCVCLLYKGLLDVWYLTNEKFQDTVSAQHCWCV